MESNVRIIPGLEADLTLPPGYGLQNMLALCERGLGAEYLANNIVVEIVRQYTAKDILLWNTAFPDSVNFWTNEGSVVEHFALQLMCNSIHKDSLDMLCKLVESRLEKQAAGTQPVLALFCLDRSLYSDKNSLYEKLSYITKNSSKSNVYLILFVRELVSALQLRDLFSVKMVTNCDDFDAAMLLLKNYRMTAYDSNNPAVYVIDNSVDALREYCIPMYDYAYLSQFNKINDMDIKQVLVPTDRKFILNYKKEAVSNEE